MKKTKKKILITGGCGYIGSQVAHDLLDQNFDVTIIIIILQISYFLFSRHHGCLRSALRHVNRHKTFPPSPSPNTSNRDQDVWSLPNHPHSFRCLFSNPLP